MVYFLLIYSPTPFYKILMVHPLSGVPTRIQEYKNTNMVYLTKKAYILCQYHGMGQV